MDSPLLLSFYLLYFFSFFSLPPSFLRPCAASTPHRHAHLPTRRPPAHLYPHTTLHTPPPTAQAIAVVGKARADALTHSLIDFLMGETDGLPKDPNYIFRLYMALGNYAQVRAREGRRLRRAAPAPRRASRAGTHGPPARRLTPAPLIRAQAASTAVIIARQEQVCRRPACSRPVSRARCSPAPTPPCLRADAPARVPIGPATRRRRRRLPPPISHLPLASVPTTASLSQSLISASLCLLQTLTSTLDHRPSTITFNSMQTPVATRSTPLRRSWATTAWRTSSYSTRTPSCGRGTSPSRRTSATRSCCCTRARLAGLG